MYVYSLEVHEVVEYAHERKVGFKLGNQWVLPVFFSLNGRTECQHSC